MHVLNLSLFFILLNLSEVCSQCTESFSIGNAIIRNHRLENYVFRTHRNVTSWLYCARLCLLRSLCRSFNYNEETLDCEINWSVNAAGGTTGEPSWLYGQKRLLPQSLIDDCANHECHDHEVCVPERDGGSTCLVVEACKGAANLVNINTKMVDGNLELSCDAGLVGVGNKVANCLFSNSPNSFYWEINYSCHDLTTCYVKSNGIAVYHGTMAEDSSHLTCLNWDQTDYTEEHMKELSASRSNNYCRDVEHTGILKCPGLYYDIYFEFFEVVVYRCSVPAC